ncbi:TonB-dependent receptor [Psychroflexus sp. ALD_RP9]|uniref:TonB-dependent receptor n=1 Tax=Psychroflexus sp. ALD_RP9 TaxID=2777186 RepID=UPI001A900115|nr:carboxypeptidase-like regulatory domain-containing protein [Psychroflexus sp. ALD_RP9]QSS97345.1 carboxypeptidase-like regulatory domain-containing protein [Psychroflexus sp. ALD_RP9]
MNHLLKIFLVLLIPLTSFAQTHKLEGKIQDSLQNSIPNTNIIATPLDTDDEITFSISDQKGRYRLKLSEHSRYLVEITYLGFQKISDTIQISENQTQNFTLKESTVSLEEVLIRQEMAVIVKEDTITYHTDQFKTGEERKLRDILKKLPGVEVDRDGNVKVNGKSVTKLMVDGKTFFTGDEKLGVNNIPADAVDEVEALDNYNEVAFLKGLEDSDKMALNIKLKDGKKKFVFGDVEVGGGVEDRFLFYPKLFYYSPKTAINVIGDVNNIGQKSFTVQDYLDFEGGFGLALEDPSTYFSLYRDDFAQFLQEDEFTYSKNDFGAASLSQELGGHFSLDAYSIFNKGKLETLTKQNLTYQANNQADEFREQSGLNELLFSINKIKLRYDNMDNLDLRANTTIKYNEGNSENLLSSFVQNEKEFVNTYTKPDNIEFAQVFNLNKQFSYKHTTKVEASLKHSDQTTDRLWNFNQALFSGIIPLVDEDDTYQLSQRNRNTINNFKLNAKHYWVLADFHHIYPVAGFNYFDTEYQTLDEQILNDGSTNSFQDAGFNNQLDFNLLDAYAGFQYKTQIDDLVLRPGLVVHNYSWNAAQFNNEIANNNKTIFLPEFFAEYEFNTSKKLKLEYNRYSNFSNISGFANRLRLQSFNQLYRGNENLENQLYNRIRLNYRNFNLFKGLTYFVNLSYSHREKSIRNQTEIEGIDQISTSIYTDLPENTYSISGNINKRIPDFSFSLGTNFSFSDYSRIINNETLAYQNNNYSYNWRVNTRFDDLPNFEVGYRHSFSRLNSDQIDNKFMRLTPFALVEYDFLDDFIFKFDYDYNYFKNQTTDNSNRFEIAESSLFYGKEDSAWSFEISATNIFDVDFKRENSVNEFIVSDRRIFLQPRTILFKLIYKL